MSSFDKFPTPKAVPSSDPADPEAAMSWHPEPVVQESPEVCAAKIEELEALFTAFQSRYDFESLRAITRFMTKEERKASPRARALEDIVPIVALVKFLENQRAVSPEAYRHLYRHYRIILDTVIGALQDSPDGIGEIVVHRIINDDGTMEG